MWRGYGKREFAAWTAIICLVAFGTGAVFMKRFRPVGPMEFHELPPAEVQPSNQSPIVPAREAAPIRSAPIGARQPPPSYSPQPPTASIERPRDSGPPATSAPVDAPGSNLNGGAARSRTKAEPEAGSISLNSGGLADLERLPGVGPTIAERIIEYRTQNGSFQSLEELRNVKGIGEKRFAKIERYLRL